MFSIGRRRSGFTLLETMISLSLLAISMVGALSMLSSSWDVLHRTQEKLEVNNILKSVLEELRDFTFDQLEALPQTLYFWPSSYGGVFYAHGGSRMYYPTEGDSQAYPVFRYLHETEGTLRLEQLQPNLIKATVEVDWQSIGGEQRVTMSTVTYLSRNGVNRQ